MSADDVLKSLEKLSVLGGGLGVVTVGGSRYVRSQPMELSRDAADALDFAQVGLGGGKVGAGSRRGDVPCHILPACGSIC